jgi:hypothetical protein
MVNVIIWSMLLFGQCYYLVNVIIVNVIKLTRLTKSCLKDISPGQWRNLYLFDYMFVCFYFPFIWSIAQISYNTIGFFLLLDLFLNFFLKEVVYHRLFRLIGKHCFLN